MPLSNAVLVAKTLPPEEAEYQITDVPVTERSDNVALTALQNACEAVPVGAAGVVLMVTVTASLEVDSQPFTVCEA